MEIREYIKQHEEGVDWVAIDDTEHFFPVDAPVYLTNSETGFTLDDVDGLQKLIMAVNYTHAQ